MVKKIRVGVDARPLSTRISGVGRLISEILKAFPNSENYEFYLFSHKPIHKDHEEILRLPYVHWMNIGGIFRWKGGLFFNLYLPVFLNKFPLEIFWGSQQVLPPFLPKAMKAVLTYCDLVLYLYPETMRLVARIQQKMVQSYSVRRADFILSISEQTSQDVCKKFQYPLTKTGVTYPGVNTNEIIKALKSKPSLLVQNLKAGYLLSVSTIEPRKNYPFLLESYRIYRKESKNPKPWVVVGKIGWESPSFIEELKKESESYGDIFLFDFISDTDLHHLYKKAGLFLFASLYEGFGIPLLEALYHRIPCLVSTLPTFYEIGKNKIMYEDTNGFAASKNWANRILDWEKKKRKNIIPPRLFTWSLAAKQTEKTFRLVTKRED